MAAENRQTALEAGLAAVLKDILLGLEELEVFVMALERLATTSLLVFRDEVVKLPQGLGCWDVAVAVASARRACPLAAELKQDAKVVFLPRLDNAAVLAHLLDKHVQTISSVASSSVGVVSGALSIAGLALIPLTAGTSLSLSMTGLGLGLASWANCAITSIVDYKLEQKSMKKISEVTENFIEDAQCLDDIASETRQLDAAVSEVLCELPEVSKVGSAADANSTVKTTKRSKEVATRVGKVVAVGGKALRNVHRAGSVAVSRTARAGLIPLNGIFIGIDIIIICTNSVALSKGCETKVSRFLRARSALWRAEMECWQRMHDSLTRGLATFEGNWAVLEVPFYRDDKQNEKQRCITQ
uniref:Uncharacterized protein n=1 Tax=Hippocampus comes TaxID=109280 RepID=A0A3Q2XN31_HIPCM